MPRVAMKQILIIEDELAYATLLQAQFEPHFTALRANTGELGLAIALKEKPDLVVVDLHTPVPNGMALLQELRKDPYGKTVPVIVVSSCQASPATIRQAIKSLPLCYLVKGDIVPQELLHYIRGVLD
jgi:DNA-binding response OmpR family regulator